MTRRLAHLQTLTLIASLVALLPSLTGATVALPGAAIDCQSVAAPRAATPGARAEPTARSATASARLSGTMTVFAGSSLTDAFEQIAADLESANPDLAIRFNFAGSQTLVAQLAQGARADVFAPADDEQMRAALANGSIATDPVTFARNHLTVVVPSGNPAGLQSAADLAGDDLRFVVAQAAVPAGRYTRQSLCAMADDTTTYGDDFIGRVTANIVSEEGDVREVLTKVRLGEADAAIVYVSDTVSAGDDVELIEIPPPVNIDATYPVAAVSEGDLALASAFIAAVLSPPGQAALAAAGFTPVHP